MSVRFFLLISCLTMVSSQLLAADNAPLTLRARLPKLPLIGDTVPDFEAQTTAGPINFPKDFKGKWVVLFSHPADFTPVCTSEFISLGAMAKQFDQLNTVLLGLSADNVSQHQKWKNAIEGKLSYKGVTKARVPFAIIGDHDMEIAWRLGMLHPRASDRNTIRAVFIIDPKSIIRAILYYPAEIGRNTSEIKRLVVALQTADRHNVATPADWQPGEDVLTKKGQQADKCQAWFFCRRRLGK